MTETIIAVIIGNFATAVIGLTMTWVGQKLVNHANRPIIYRGGTAKEVEQNFRSKMQDPDAESLYSHLGEP